MFDVLTTLLLFFSLASLHLPLLVLKKRKNIFLANLVVFINITFPRILQTLPGYFLFENKDQVTYLTCFSISITYLFEALLFYFLLNTSFVRKLLFKKYNQLETQFSINKDFLIIIFGILLSCMTILTITSGGSFLLNSREFYQYNRAGFGSIWSLYVSLLGILQPLSFLLFSNKKSKSKNKHFLKICILGFIFLVLASFSGSKFVILTTGGQFLCLTYIFQSDLFKKVFLYGTPFILLFLFANFFNNFSNILVLKKTILYVTGTFDVTRLMFEQILNNSFQYFNGEILLSKFYSLVPRLIFPEKPFVFGQTLLIERYIPGTTELGHTPSFGAGSYGVADFGIPLGNIISVISPNMIIYLISLTCLTYDLNYLSKVGFFFVITIAIYFTFSFHIPVFLSMPFYLLMSFLSFKLNYKKDIRGISEK